MKSLKIVGLSALVACVVGLLTFNSNRKDSLLSEKVREVEAKADYAAHVAEYADRVLDLPEDAENWHVTVFTHSPASEREQRILSWFESEEQLRRLKASTHFHVYNPSSKVYSRYTNLATNGETAVVVQQPDGSVIYKASGDSVPNAPWPLIKGIKDCVLSHCPHLRPKPKPNPKPCPCPQPEPKPSPEPSPPQPNVIPDIVGPEDETPPDGRDDTLWVVGVVFVVCLAAGFATSRRKDAAGRVF